MQKLRYEVVFATSGSAPVDDSGWPHALYFSNNTHGERAKGCTTLVM